MFVKHGRTLISVLTLVVLGLAMLASPTGVSAQETLEITESNSWFEGTSTVRDWACKTVPMSGSFSVDEGFDSTANLLRNVENQSVSGTVSVPSKDIKCEQGETMNGHLRDALEVDNYAKITYNVENVTSIQPPEDGADTYTGEVEGTLSITGTKRDVPLTLSVVPGSGDDLRLVGSKELNIKDFGIKPPTVMWTITVYKDITVHLDLLLN